MKYAFILAELMAYPLSVVCRVLNVTQSGFHAWRVRAPSKRAQERDRLSGIIRKVFDAHRGRYGAPRIYRVMCERDGDTGSLNRIQALMRAMKLRASVAFSALDRSTRTPRSISASIVRAHVRASTLVLKYFESGLNP